MESETKNTSTTPNFEAAARIFYSDEANIKDAIFVLINLYNSSKALRLMRLWKQEAFDGQSELMKIHIQNKETAEANAIFLQNINNQQQKRIEELEKESLILLYVRDNYPRIHKEASNAVAKYDREEAK